MKYRELKRRVLEANLGLKDSGLIILTWGNASEVDRNAGVVAIKPSGVEYHELTENDIVIVSLEDGRTVEGGLKPSSDTPTHLCLYRAFPDLGGVVHTHSRHATAWAQAGIPIPALGTTHADYFAGPVPVTRELTRDEIETDYEANTGKVIVERFGTTCPSAGAVLVPFHGPFVWAGSARKAWEYSVVLEEVAAMACLTFSVRPDTKGIPDVLLDKHYSRKHGPKAYYGQVNTRS